MLEAISHFAKFCPSLQSRCPKSQIQPATILHSFIWTQPCSLAYILSKAVFTLQLKSWQGPQSPQTLKYLQSDCEQKARQFLL